MKTILFTLILLVVNTAFSQTESNYEGNEKDCPYIHPENVKQNKKDAKTLVIDDFESSEKTYKQWSNGSESGSVKSDITINDAGKESKKGATISFSGKKTKESWTNLFCKTSFSEGHSIVTFWAKAPKEIKIQLTVKQGKTHDEMEIYGHTFTIGKKWKLYHIRLAEVNEFVFSHLIQGGKASPARVINSKVIGIGFAEINSPIKFSIDDLQIH